MSDIGIIKDGAVLIHDDKIVAVGTTKELDEQINIEEYEVIDASGKTVMPGLLTLIHILFSADTEQMNFHGD